MSNTNKSAFETAESVAMAQGLSEVLSTRRIGSLLRAIEAAILESEKRGADRERDACLALIGAEMSAVIDVDGNTVGEFNTSKYYAFVNIRDAIARRST